MGNLPTKATEIAQKLHAYDAIFALGGKSLITILYTEGSAVPPGMQIFQLSADARDLGRTYSTKLALVGDIRASLRALLPLLTPKLADRERYTPLCARQPSANRRPAAAAEGCCRCGARQASDNTASCWSRDGARHRPRSRNRRRGAGNLGRSARVFEHRSTRQYSLRAAGRSAGVCRRRLASRSASTARQWSRSSAMAQRCTHRRRCGQRLMNGFL